MLDLSPTKLLIIFIVVVVLLGPKRLPEVARQLGAGWRKLRDLHGQLDRELRQTLPDLPSSQDIVRFARSPLSLLNHLADPPDPRSDDGVGASEGLVGDGAAPRADPPDGAASHAAGPEDAGSEASAPRPLPGHRVLSNGNGPAALGEGSGRPAALPSFAGLDADDPNLN